MTCFAELLNLFQTFEVELHRLMVRRDPQRVAALLHDDFEEISIWILTEKEGWQMRFHQGTPTDD